MESNKEKIRKANKEHRCWLCNEIIAKGELYVDKVSLLDGFVKSKTHTNCEALLAQSECADKQDFIEAVLIEYSQRKGVPEKFRNIDVSFKRKIDYLFERDIENK